MKAKTFKSISEQETLIKTFFCTLTTFKLAYIQKMLFRESQKYTMIKINNSTIPKRMVQCIKISIYYDAQQLDSYIHFEGTYVNFSRLLDNW